MNVISLEIRNKRCLSLMPLQDMGLRMVRLIATISFVVLLSLASPGKAQDARTTSLRSGRRSLQAAPSEVRCRLFAQARAVMAPVTFMKVGERGKIVAYLKSPSDRVSLCLL